MLRQIRYNDPSRVHLMASNLSLLSMRWQYEFSSCCKLLHFLFFTQIIPKVWTLLKCAFSINRIKSALKSRQKKSGTVCCHTVPDPLRGDYCCLLTCHGTLFGRFTLCQDFLVACVVQVSDRNPGMRHLVSGAAASHYPEIRIRIVGVAGSVVIPLLDHKHGASGTSGATSSSYRWL